MVTGPQVMTMGNVLGMAACAHCAAATAGSFCGVDPPSSSVPVPSECWVGTGSAIPFAGTPWTDGLDSGTGFAP
jgi:hypothetical protein